MEKTILTHGWRLKALSPTHALPDVIVHQAMHSDWDDDWIEVPDLPAMVHDVLLSHTMIETPWLPGKAEACRWVAETDWVYAVRFTIDDPGNQHFLHFKGLDCIVDIVLNGVLIGQHSNVFMPLRLDVTPHLKRENTLILHFHTVFDQSSSKPQPIWFVDGDPRRPVRKVRKNYNTYLGPQPYFSHMGVFDDIVLEKVDKAEITTLLVNASLSADHNTGMVKVQATGTSCVEDLSLEVRLQAPDGTTAGKTRAPVAVREGEYNAEVMVQVNRPLLWWPRGYGDQPLYQAELVLVAGGQVVDQYVRTVGFRRITMPEPLHFEVNGTPVRLWGGNWVNPDWVTEVWNPDKAERLFDIAENAHFNAFRIWGEVKAPDDHLYEMADRRGFLLWQDFTELLLKPDEISRAICREESAYMVQRMAHHPSILMWCGGNEAAMWHDSEFGGPGGAWPGRVPAEQDVKAVCDALDPERFYLPNSPYYGIDANDPKQWDTHGYTNMWFVPGYDHLVFASEDTRIAAPPLHSLKRFFAPEDLWPEDYSPVYQHGNQYPWPESWMRYTTSASWKKTGPVEQFYDATNPAELVYRLGMAEGLYYQDTIERQRRGRPSDEDSQRQIAGGFLVWKFNDSWPQIYSGKVDYFLEPYIPYYVIRRAYTPFMLSFDVGSYVWLWAVNDRPEPVEGEICIQLFHLHKNAVVKQIVRQIEVAPGQSTQVVRLDQAGIGTFDRDHVLYACMRDAQGKTLARSNALVDIERHITFPEARLDVQVRDGVLVITTDQFARSVVLEGNDDGDEFGWFFEDNWFDLLPGETKVVRVLGDHKCGRIAARAWYSPHTTEIAW